MHGEPEIKDVINLLLEKYGAMNMSQIKLHLHEVLEYDEDDTIESKTRPNESLIIQRIGNIVSHQEQTICEYPGGYTVDKSVFPAIFTLKRE